MLTREQVIRNQERYGWNELEEVGKKSPFLIFLEQFKDFLVVILMVAAVISGVLKDVESAIVILVVLVINAILGTVQTLKAEQSLEGLKKLSAPEAKVIRDGKLIQVPAREVTVGDEVIIEAGDLVPADGRLLTCASLKVDESALTGESLSVEKSLEEVAEGAALGDQTNRVFSGGLVTYGRGSFEVTNIGMKTEVGKIAGLLEKTQEKRTPLQVNLDDFGKKLSLTILVFCGLLFGLTVVRGGNPMEAFLFAVALAVAAIPEALSSIVTIVLSFGTQKMAKEKAIIRKLQAVEGLGSVSIICSDKTGTLTQNKMTVEDYYVGGKRVPRAEISLEEESQRRLLEFSVLCNDSSIREGQEIGDPTETALVQLAIHLGEDVETLRQRKKRCFELPFDSDRKLMSICHREEDGSVLVVKGAVDVLLNRVVQVCVGKETVALTPEIRREIEKQNEEFSKSGLRVLAFGYKALGQERELEYSDEEGLTFLGLISMMDPPREESKQAVAECIQAGIKPIMITGDHKVTAAAIAKRIGILKDEKEACEGAEIESFSDEELREFVEGISVYARVSPEHKIRIVRAWQEKGHIVSMTGDGVNDAPALKQADVGVAMGITGSEVSKDAAAMVLADDNFATIVKAIESGRNIFANIKKAIQFLLSGNFGAILAVLYASIANLPVPFAPVHLLFINLLTDSLPAIALGLETHSDAVMREKPRPINESILTGKFLRRIGLEGFVIGGATMVAFLLGLQAEGSLLGSTMAFGTLCLSRLFHGFSCKSKERVLLKKEMWNNPFLIGAFLLGGVLITGVLMIPTFHQVFKVQTLDISQLSQVYLISVLSFFVIQILKRKQEK